MWRDTMLLSILMEELFIYDLCNADFYKLFLASLKLIFPFGNLLFGYFGHLREEKPNKDHDESLSQRH